jgi:hypothetical protein
MLAVVPGVGDGMKPTSPIIDRIFVVARSD